MDENQRLTEYCDNLSEAAGKESIKLDISAWVDRDDVDIYWRNSSKRYRTFSASGRPAPDMLIDGANAVYAVCVAEADKDSANVRKTALRAVNVWERLVEDSPQYECNLSQDTPSAVLIASEYSKDGHLFTDAGNLEEPRTDISDEREELARKDVLPSFEYTGTETCLRTTWQFAKERAEPTDLGIGALLSSQLDQQPDEEIIDPEPGAFYYVPGRSKVHEWELIPFYL